MAKSTRRNPRPPAGGSRWLFLLLLLSLLAVAGWGWRWAHTAIPLADGPQRFTVAPGSSMQTVAQQLAAQGIVDSALLLEWLGRLNGTDGSLKAGSYSVKEAQSPLTLLARLSAGDRDIGVLTLIEGWNWRQIRAALDLHPDLRHDSSKLDDAALLRAIGSGVEEAEGWFFPDTYHFDRGSSDLHVLRQAHRLMKQALDKAWREREPGLPLQSQQQLLTLASIVEKETGQTADRERIAAVFVNRLRLGMRLQTDPTVIYGLGPSFDGNLRKIDLQTDTPYNSYTRAGLPPTPIASPGRASLNAAAHPAPGKALYFVARGDGGSYFSETLAQHNQAVNRFIRGKP